MNAIAGHPGWPEGFGRVDLQRVDSTNAEARRRAAAGEIGPVWISAERQLQGRGRRSRHWRSSEGDVTATLLLRPESFRPGATAADVGSLTFAAALAVSDAVIAAAPAARVAHKWPNDVLVDGRKLSGILLEAEASRDGEGGWLAIGVGVNVVRRDGEDVRFDDDGAQTPPIALQDVAPSLDREQTLTLLAAAMARRLDDWAIGGFAALRADWLARAARLGEELIARLPRETIAGRFVDLDDAGALLLETSDGLRRIAAADVFFP